MPSLPSTSVFVEEVKYKLEKIMNLLPERDTNIFFMNIKLCFEMFWHYKRRESGLQDFYYTSVLKQMDDTIANTIIKKEVMPLLEQVKSNSGQYPAVVNDFQSLYSYIQTQFREPTQSPSIPTPQMTTPSVSHASAEVTSLHSEVRGLQSRISALESALKGFYTKNAAYDTAIATLQTEMSKLPQILQRLEKLETPFFSRFKTKKPSSTAEMQTLLQKMNDLNA